MKVITEERIIPEKRYMTTKYVALDDKEFDTAQACLAYEERLKVERHPMIQTAILGVMPFLGGDSVNLYYISNADDYNFFMKYVVGSGRRIRCKSDFCDYGEGWYLYWSDSDACCDYHDLHNYDAYVAEVESELQEWKNNIQRKMASKKEEL